MIISGVLQQILESKEVKVELRPGREAGNRRAAWKSHGLGC
jgi:hypothetical protein